MIYLAVHGEMSERFKEPVLKTGDSFCEPWVRIPLSPPFIFRERQKKNIQVFNLTMEKYSSGEEAPLLRV